MPEIICIVVLVLYSEATKTPFKNQTENNPLLDL